MKKHIILFALALLVVCNGCRWMPSAVKSYQQEYDELNAEQPATTAADAKKQYEEVDEFVGRLKAEKLKDLPDGLLAKAVELDATRLAHCGKLAFVEKATDVWEWAKKKLNSDGVSPKEAAKIEPALAGPLEVTTTTSATTDTTSTTTSSEPDDNWEHFK